MHAFNPRQKQVDLCEHEAGLMDIVRLSKQTTTRTQTLKTPLISGLLLPYVYMCGPQSLSLVSCEKKRTCVLTEAIV